MALTIAKFRNSNGVLVPAPPTVVLRPKTQDPQQTLKVNRKDCKNIYTNNCTFLLSFGVAILPMNAQTAV